MKIESSADIDPRQLAILNEQDAVSLTWLKPEGGGWATVILAHGAGAAMDSPFMQKMAECLCAEGLAVVRFEFAYMAASRVDGRRRPPDRQPKLLQCWRQVYAQVCAQVPAASVVIGGKSMGGRMASLLADELGARALLCLGYPFHPPGKPENLRVAHLQTIATPGLIIQGERDPFGKPAEVAGYQLADCIELYWLKAADHDFVPLKSVAIDQQQHLRSSAQKVASWLQLQFG